MVKHTFFAISIGLIAFFLYLLQYTGAFKSVPIVIDERGPFTMIAKLHSGPYHKIVPVIEEVEKWARKNGLKCRLSFGEYLDNPRLVEEGRLQSYGGCLVDPLVAAEKNLLESLKTNLPDDFVIRNFQKSNSVAALFSGAPGIGPLKVYPKVEDFIENGKLLVTGKVLEIYEVLDPKNVVTLYIWPLSIENSK